MLCENCQKSFATVHLRGWRRTPAGSGEEEREVPFEHHFCGECYEGLKKTNPLFNPMLAAGPGARLVKLRVISASPGRIVVKPIGPQSDATQDEWGVLASRFPPKYSVPGMEFEMVVTDAHLKYLQGEE